MESDKKLLIFYFGAFVAVASATALVLCGVFVARPGLWAKNFQETLCQVEGHQLLKHVECECSTTTDCSSTYPCYVVNVSYSVIKGKNETRKTFSILYQDEDVATSGSKCSFLPSCSASTSTNDERVQSLLSKYATVNSSYTCFYNPKNTRNVIAYRKFSVAEIITSLLIPGCLFLFGFVIVQIYIIRKYREKLCSSYSLSESHNGSTASYTILI